MDFTHQTYQTLLVTLQKTHSFQTFYQYLKHPLREHGGASVLTHIESIRKAYQETLRLKRKPQRPEKWDGKTAGRCLEAILEVSE